MKVPYALQDFRAIRQRNLLYVDKTKYIEILEQTEDYVLFLRPRRFGKTLFTSMLEYYYDIQFKTEFDQLFGGLYIAEHKTVNANNYYVLKFNFSGLCTEKEKLEKSFADCIKLDLMRFINAHNLDIKLNQDTNESNIIIRDFLTEYEHRADRKIYLLIDEYDHFANNVMSEDRRYFNQITGKDGFVRTFYEVFKMFAGNTIERIFITGVTPITVDSLTSGFNISKNIGNKKGLNEMVGFTEEEVKYLLKECQIDEEYITVLKEHYNGYLFNKKAECKIYNSNLLMYFLSEYLRENLLPDSLIDENVVSDYSKITNLFELYEDEKDKTEIIVDIVSGVMILGELHDKIGPLLPRSLRAADQDRLGFSRDDFLSLLYYLGLLTISSTSGAYVYLSAPNDCISKVYAKFYISYLYHRMDSEYTMQKEIGAALHALITRNHTTQYKEVVEKLLRGIANNDFMKFDEKYVKLMMYTVAKYSNVYLVKTEYEVSGGGKADLVLLPNQVAMADNYYVIEIKYIKKSEYTKNRLSKERQDAIDQVNTYANATELRCIANLRKYVVVAVKDELLVFEEVTN